MKNSVFIAIDVQLDFCPNGALAVADGDGVVAPINAAMQAFDHVILTQDWHPKNHSSFASQHPGHDAFTMIEFDYGPQTLWPDHCIQGSEGARFHPDLNQDKAQAIIRKGFRQAVDSYSAFYENDQKTPTGLQGYLAERGLTSVTLAGLATDYCVAYSALDARRIGLDCTVLLPACRAIDLDGSLKKALQEMQDVGVKLIDHI